MDQLVRAIEIHRIEHSDDSDDTFTTAGSRLTPATQGTSQVKREGKHGADVRGGSWHLSV